MIYFVSKDVAAGRVKRLYAKNSRITSWYVGKSIEVYAGNKFIDLDISKKMVGHKFGEYIMTKRMGSYIHKKKAKRKQKRKGLKTKK